MVTDSYGTGGGRALSVTIFAPDRPTTRTAVLLLHGGAWRVGSPADMAPYGRALAASGFVALAVEYRLLGEAPWPAQLEDVKAAIGWTRDNAERLGIEPGRIALEGFSAGGHLALLAAGTGRLEDTASPVAAVIACFAPAEFTAGPPSGHAAPAAMLLGAVAAPETARAISPLSHVGPGFPPTFLIHGVADRLLPWQGSVALFEALVAAGTPAELHLVHDHTHEFTALPSMLEPIQAEIALFLRRAVVDPAHYRQENLDLNMFARPGFPPG
jgi:acetyl esterase/lipase